MKTTLAVALGATAWLFVASAAKTGAELFPYQQDWMGGDAAYSIPLDAQRSLWLFGDTFIGRRSDATMIHNSIAIRKCDPDCKVDYWWSGKKNGHPDSFFKTPDSNYFWPLDGLVTQGTLYIFLEQMRATPEGGAFGFDYQAVKLATISNAADPPDRWKITYQSVSEGNQAVPGVGAAIATDRDVPFLYAFTLFRGVPAKSFVGMLRKPTSQLHSDSAPWQYLSTASTWLDWKKSASPTNASALLRGNITEMSVEYHSAEHAWLSVFPTPDQKFLTASFSRASQITGPWSTPEVLYTYPEMSPNNPHHTPNVFCYAAKEHLELESSGMLALTYACNSFKEPEIFKDLQLYRPQLAFVPSPLR